MIWPCCKPTSRWWCSWKVKTVLPLVLNIIIPWWLSFKINMLLVDDWYNLPHPIFAKTPMASSCNSMWLSDTFWRHRPGSTLARTRTICLKAASHYLNQGSLIIIGALWHDADNDTSAIQFNSLFGFRRLKCTKKVEHVNVNKYKYPNNQSFIQNSRMWKSRYSDIKIYITTQYQDLLTQTSYIMHSIWYFRSWGPEKCVHRTFNKW